MTKKITLSRPAASAIAAFLVLSTPSAFAQTEPVAPPVMTPPVSPTTAPAPTVSAPVATPAQPTPVIRVPLDIEPAPAPVAKAAPRPAAKAPARPAVAARTAAPEPVAAAATTTAADVIPADAAATALPEATIAPVAPVVDAAPTPVAEAAVANNSFPWELAGGAAALLIVGGAGLAFTRRRRSSDEEVVYESAPIAAPVVARTPEPIAPPIAPAQPAYALREEQVIAPPAPQQRTTPAFAAAPSGSMGRHEAMALAGPTADNPFLTLRKRLKRARFHDRKERTQYGALLESQQQVARQPASAWEIANRPAPAVAAQQAARRPDQAPLFPGRLRPGFAGN